MIDNIHIAFEDWLTQHPISPKNCFLCGVVLTPDIQTKEHVIPRWVQSDFDLATQPMTLPNRTTIPYGQLVIPCCQPCNNGPLAKMEDCISTGVRSGFNSFIATVPTIRIFQWLQSIAYKLLFKDLQLKNDRRDKLSTTIMEPEDLARLRLSHFFLRSIDEKLVFRNFFPASIYLVRVKTHADKRKNFDYIDSIPEQCIAIRVGDIGMIGILQDAGLQEKTAAQGWINHFLDKVLNPVQFKNLFAKCVYAQQIFSDPFSYEVVPQSDSSYSITAHINKSKVPEHGLVYGNLVPDDYAKVLAAVLHCKPEAIRLPNGDVGSLFYDTEGNWKDRDFDDDGSIQALEDPIDSFKAHQHPE